MAFNHPCRLSPLNKIFVIFGVFLLVLASQSEAADTSVLCTLPGQTFDGTSCSVKPPPAIVGVPGKICCQGSTKKCCVTASVPGVGQTPVPVPNVPAPTSCPDGFTGTACFN